MQRPDSIDLPSTFTTPYGNASIRLCEGDVKPPHSKAGCARKMFERLPNLNPFGVATPTGTKGSER